MKDTSIGDVVKLKSGGPAMTVSYVYADEITCQWFDNQTKKEATFQISQLEKYKPAKIQIRSRVI